jgi:hypothetical protein
MSAPAGLTADQLQAWLERHPDTTPGTVVATKDRALSLSSRLVRAVWRGQHTLAVGSDVAPVVRIGALLDLIAWHLSVDPPPGIDPGTVTLLLAHTTQESSDAIRVLSGALTRGPRVQVLHQAEGHADPAFEEDTGTAPDYAESAKARQWAGYLAGWSSARPSGAALRLAELVGSDTLRLYPMLTRSPDPPLWSVRLDGLEVGRVNDDGGVLDVGKDSPAGQRSIARRTWLDVWPAGALAFTADPASPSSGTQTLETAADRLKALIDAFGGAHAPAGLAHGQPEHALESRVLRGAVPVDADGETLVPAFDDPLVSRGSQFPTLWGRDGRAHYLDALLRRGRVPWAAELKILGGGGAGAYYRHGVAQAVLYRHFIRSAAPVHAWFADADMDAGACRACLAVPLAPSPAAATQIKALRALARLFNVSVAELDWQPAITASPLVPEDELGDEDIEPEPGDTVIELRPDDNGTLVPYIYTHPAAEPPALDRVKVAPRTWDEVERVDMDDWVSGWLALGCWGEPAAGYARLSEGAVSQVIASFTLMLPEGGMSWGSCPTTAHFLRYDPARNSVDWISEADGLWSLEACKEVSERFADGLSDSWPTVIFQQLIDACPELDVYPLSLEQAQELGWEPHFDDRNPPPLDQLWRPVDLSTGTEGQ